MQLHNLHKIKNHRVPQLICKTKKIWKIYFFPTETLLGIDDRTIDGALDGDDKVLLPCWNSGRNP